MEQREIKFRVWNGEEMIILKNSGLQYYDFEGSYSLGFTVDAYEGFWAHEQYESATKKASTFPIMQYTGLKDKNGKEIYVKDLLSEKWKVEVYQHKNTGAFMVKFHNNPIGNKPVSLYQYLKNRELAGTSEIDCIVIGNTIQDKHLLT